MGFSVIKFHFISSSNTDSKKTLAIIEKISNEFATTVEVNEEFHPSSQKNVKCIDTYFKVKNSSNLEIFLYVICDHDRLLSMSQRGMDKMLTEYNSWKQYAVERGVDILVLNESTKLIVDFLEKIIFGEPEVMKLLSPKNVFEEIMQNNTSLINKNVVILVDCDKTISMEDTGKFFIELENKDYSRIKKVFFGDFYTPYQFYRSSQIYSELLDDVHISPGEILQKVHLNEILLKDLSDMKKYANIIWITSGLKEIWAEIAKITNVPDILISGSFRSPVDPIITSDIKLHIVKFLRKLGYYVISIGDSIADIWMLLESNLGYVVSNKNNKALASFFDTNETNVKQFGYNLCKYHNLEMSEGILRDHIKKMKNEN